MTSQKRLAAAYLLLAHLLVILFAANIFWGSVALTPGAVVSALLGRGQDALSVGIITQLRLPRAVMVVLLGAALRRRATCSRPSSPTPSRAPSSWASPAGPSWPWRWSWWSS